MNLTIVDYYNEQIRNHQNQHIADNTYAISVLQILYSDPSCVQCYPPTRTSQRSEFSRFWRWYQATFPAFTYNRQTQTAFRVLNSTTNPIFARTAARNLIFSCRYLHTNYSPRDILIRLFRATTFETPPEFPAQNWNTFDQFLESPYYPYRRDPNEPESSEPNSPSLIVEDLRPPSPLPEIPPPVINRPLTPLPIIPPPVIPQQVNMAN